MNRQEIRKVLFADYMTGQSKNLPKKEAYGRGSESIKIPSSALPNSSALTSLYDQINYATTILKEKTISLVCQLRKYSLQQELQAQIEHYLTDVLDQMDLVLAKKNICEGIEQSKQEREPPSNFEQLPKPPGDDECFHAEQTFRQIARMPLEPIQQLSKEATQVELSSKIQSILSELQNGSNAYTRSSNQYQKYAGLSNIRNDQTEDVSTENRTKNQTKAHRFSNSYIRDVNRNKKSRLV